MLYKSMLIADDSNEWPLVAMPAALSWVLMRAYKGDSVTN